MMNRQNTLFFILFLCTFISAQVFKGKIIDKSDQTKIAFASVLAIKGQQVKSQISDANGAFILNFRPERLIASSVGYISDTIDVKSLAGAQIVIELEGHDQFLKQMEVSPANNPALRIIRQALKNKKLNDFEGYPQYAYRSYNRTAIDFLQNENASDENAENKNVKKRTPFVSESVLLTRRCNNETESKIIAQHAAGIKSPLLSQYFALTFHQTISFYKNIISLFQVPVSESDLSESEFISPLSDNCLSTYYYDLENTIVNAGDTVFEISYFPRKQFRATGLKGKLFISSNQYAIQSIVAEPSSKALIVFKFKENFEYTDGRWFPVLLEEEVGVKLRSGKLAKNIYPSYVVHVTLDDIRYSLSGHEQKIHPDRIFIDPNCKSNNDSLLNVVRTMPMSARDSSCYHVMDSVRLAKNLNKLVILFPKLAIGRLPIGVLDVDFAELIKSNAYEGYRPTLGLYTNEALSTFVSVGGFARYGERDRKWKYGASLLFDIYRKYDVQLGMSYQHNLKEYGVNMSDNRSTVVLGEYLRDFLGSRYDDCVQKQIDFGFRVLRGLKIVSKLTLRDITPLYDYRYNNQTLTNYRSDELSLEARYAFNENYSTYGKVRLTNFAGNPILFFSYRRGVDFLRAGSLVYNKIEMGIQARRYSGRLGQSSVFIKAGYVDRDLPASLLFSGEGSRNSSTTIQVANTFQTMKPYEFLSDKYVNMFFTHNFGNLILNSTKFKPRFSVSQNAGWGSLRNANIQEIDFKTKEKVFLESGVRIDDIVKMNMMNFFYINFGVSGFYRWGAYQNKSFDDNYSVKLAIRISTK